MGLVRRRRIDSELRREVIRLAARGATYRDIVGVVRTLILGASITIGAELGPKDEIELKYRGCDIGGERPNPTRLVASVRQRR